MRISSANRSARPAAAFSLTELLVVTAIILLLCGLIAGIYARAKSAAKVTACLANLSQIGRAATLYAADYDGYAPLTLTKSLYRASSNQDLELLAFGDPALWRQSLMPYVRIESIFYCPSDSRARTELQEACAEPANSLFTSYATVPIVNGDIVENRRIAVSIDAPRFSHIPYVTDRVCQTRDLQTGAIIYTSPHGSKQSRLYIDGHVKHTEIRAE